MSLIRSRKEKRYGHAPDVGLLTQLFVPAMSPAVGLTEPVVHLHRKDTETLAENIGRKTEEELMVELLKGESARRAGEKQKEHPNPCEWNPDEQRAAYIDDEVHAKAEVIVGADGHWRLCASCAALPFFAGFRVTRITK